jgi:glucose/arabinose dehydrogenase
MPTLCVPGDDPPAEPVTRRAAARRAAAALLLILSLASPPLRAQDGASEKSPPAPAARPQLELQIGQTGAVYEVAFSPDGTWIASAGGDTIKLWDVPTGTLRRTLTGHRGIVYSVALSPDGRTLASGGEDTTVRLWDSQTGAVRRTLTGHTAVVRAVAFSPDGKLVASAGADAAVKLWDAQTGALGQRGDLPQRARRAGVGRATVACQSAAGGNEFYFATYEVDAATPSRVAETALPWTVFQTTLAKVDAKRVFLFLDACHSGSALGSQQASSERLAEALARRRAGL